MFLKRGPVLSWSSSYQTQQTVCRWMKPSTAYTSSNLSEQWSKASTTGKYDRILSVNTITKHDERCGMQHQHVNFAWPCNYQWSSRSTRTIVGRSRCLHVQLPRCLVGKSRLLTRAEIQLVPSPDSSLSIQPDCCTNALALQEVVWLVRQIMNISFPWWTGSNETNSIFHAVPMFPTWGDWKAPDLTIMISFWILCS